VFVESKNKHQPVASEESCLIDSKRIGFQVPTANKVGTHTFWYKKLDKHWKDSFDVVGRGWNGNKDPGWGDPDDRPGSRGS
jgi:hypothetical protein